MADIVETIVGDKRLQLGNEEFVRKMGIRTNWNKIRIAIRVGVNGSSSILTQTFQLGLCEGTTNTFKDSNTTGYLGMAWGDVYSSTATYTPGSPNVFYFGGNGGIQSVVRTGGSTTTAYQNTSLIGTAFCQVPYRSTWFFDVTRLTATSYKCEAYGPGWGAATHKVDTSLSTYYTQLESESSPPLLQYFINGGWVVNSVTASLDTISILWNKSTPTIEISDVNVLRFY